MVPKIIVFICTLIHGVVCPTVPEQHQSSLASELIFSGGSQLAPVTPGVSSHLQNKVDSRKQTLMWYK